MVPYETMNTQRDSANGIFPEEELALMPITGTPFAGDSPILFPFLAFSDDDEEDDVDEEDNFDDMEDDFNDDFDDEDDDFDDDDEEFEDEDEDDFDYEEDVDYDDFDE
ncbi:hypothetical protein FACS189476_04450 [Spirochaetia bacterium]|nr:hypothetical protein FACS189476_04450 [Spirochaetia bacterium]